MQNMNTRLPSLPARTRARRWVVSALAATSVAGVGAAALELVLSSTEEDQPAFEKAPVDRGNKVAKRAKGARLLQATSLAPLGISDAHVSGSFGSAFEWPIIPIHTVLLSDGRVLSYGADTAGEQSGLLYYALWDPALGIGPESMQVLDNTSGTDTFCVGQALLPSGNVLLVGGDRSVDGQRNFGLNDVNIFTPSDNVLNRQAQSMAYQRWYPTVITTGDGEQVVLGGRIDKSMPKWVPPLPATFAATPEVYNQSSGWRTLTNATSDRAYGKSSTDNWSYPHAWLGPDGKIDVLTNSGEIYALDKNGLGKIKKVATGLPISKQFNSAAMYAPGKVLSIRTGGLVSLVDLNVSPPTITPTGAMSQGRFYGNATLLADGRVWANGGSSKGNKLTGAAYHSEIWDKATGTWTTTASATKPRLYHSIAMLMPDATVLTAGGGAPGPVMNLNAEIYYPPYLYKTDGSGETAPRPVIASAPTAGTWGQVIGVSMSTGEAVSRVTLVRFGGVTHAFSTEQRFEDLVFGQTGPDLNVSLPTSPNVAPPGFYMLFAFDAAGVPSVAKVIRIS